MARYWIAEYECDYRDDNAALYGEKVEAVEAVPGGYVCFETWGDVDELGDALEAKRTYVVTVPPEHVHQLCRYINGVRGHGVIAVSHVEGLASRIDVAYNSGSASPDLVSVSARRLGGVFCDSMWWTTPEVWRVGQPGRFI